MKPSILRKAIICALISHSVMVSAETDETINKKLQVLEQRLQTLEDEKAASSPSSQSIRRVPAKQVSNNGFNPAISVIIDGGYASYKNNPEDYVLPGYALGGEAELSPEGFSLGHSEITMSNNIDDKFYGQFTIAVAEHDNEVEVELEEAFFEAMLPVDGLTLRGGRFFSGIGYLNQQHEHAWDFYDAPLIYRGLFGNHYVDDGVRVSFIAPTDLFIELGAEAFAGKKFPAGGEHSNIGSWTTFVNLGGDIGVSHSWQAGLSYWRADEIEREYGSHSHGGGAAVEVPVFSGDSDITGLNAVYKWAPNGNYRDQNFKLQFEYFKRNDDGELTLLDSNPLETSTLNSEQDGWYLQAIWQFEREWRVGLRYDSVDSDNQGSDLDVLDEAGLLANGHRPERSSVMAEWTPSEFSRIRLQYNHDQSYSKTDDQLFLQYTFSIGAHGAHAF